MEKGPSESTHGGVFVGSQPLSWPLQVPADLAADCGPRWAARWIWLLIGLGIAARVVRFALNFPLGSDESYVASNLIHKGYLDLLGPLNYEQVCPLLFLWAQMACVKLLGFNEYALRLPALVFGVVSLFVFRHVAGRLLKGTALVLAVGIFAASYPAIRYSAEAKPYESDVLVALLLLGGFVEWLRNPGQTRWLWALTAALPILLGLSYPALFVAGAVSLAIAIVLAVRGLHRGWLVWVAYNLVLLDTFLALYTLSMANQCSGCLTEMRLFWHDAFPPLDRPLALFGWLVSVHAGPILAHPFGGPNGGSTLTLAACVIAVAWLLRRGQIALAMACLFPLGLNLAAAAVQRYPYGGHVRLMMYFAPACCLLAGLGVAVVLARPMANPRARRAGLSAVLALLALLPVGSMLRDVRKPYRTDWDVRAREFARWFWASSEERAEVACLKTDLGQDFSPDNFRLRFSAMYLCNQRIYSPRRARGEPLRWDRVGPDRPLYCVEYRSPLFRYEPQTLEAWLETMRSRYALTARRTFPMPAGKGPHNADWVEVYEFVPQARVAARTTAGSTPPK